MSDLPTFSWFDQVPDDFATENQLGELGLRPGGPVRGRVKWRAMGEERFARLYLVAEARPKRTFTDAQRRALEARTLAARTCVVCRRTFPRQLHGPTCRDCRNYNLDGTPRYTEGSLLLLLSTPGYHAYRVWLPITHSFGPYTAPIDPAVTHRVGSYLAGKSELRLLLDSRDEYQAALPYRTHCWYHGPWFDEWIARQEKAFFLDCAAQWPLLREWAAVCDLPHQTYLPLAMEGLDERAQADMRTLWYTEYTLWCLDFPEVLKHMPRR